MSGVVPESALAELSRAVGIHLGLHVPKDRFTDLERALTKAAAELGFDGGHSLARWLLASNDHEARIETLTSYLTIGETHFFRDEKLFQVMEEDLLPRMLAERARQGKRLRIWSAGCATGEEPYTIAIVLRRLLANAMDWNITLMGTDINRVFLEKAGQGIYSRWSFRTVPPGIEDTYFIKREQELEIIPEIKRMVKFGYLNLVRKGFPSFLNDTGHMDVIFCRNVLMYFTPEHQGEVVKNFCDCLVDGGLLIISPAEACIVTDSRMSPVDSPGVVLFRKSEKPSVSRPPFNPDFSITFLDESLANRAQLVLPSRPPTDSPAVKPVVPAAVRPQPEPAVTGEPECDPYLEAVNLYDDGHYMQAVDKLVPLLRAHRIGVVEAGPAMSLVSKSYANLGRLDEALEWSEKAVAENKLNPYHHYFQGTILEAQGRLHEAVRAMTKGVFLDPRLAVAHFHLGHLYRQMGRQRESDRHFSTALTILADYAPDQVVPASEGMTAGRLSEMIMTMT